MPQATTAPAAGSGSKTGLIVALVAVVAALGVGGYLGYRVLFAESGEGAMTAPQTPAIATPSPPADAAKEPTVASPAQPAAADSTSLQQAAPAIPPPASESKSAAPAQPTDAARATATGSAAGKSPPGAPKADSTKAMAPAVAPPAAEPTPRVAAPAPARSTSPVAGVQLDRWQQMAEAMAQCRREDCFSRVGCEQRVGRRFCEGYWGTVPQCPSGVPRERGQ